MSEIHAQCDLRGNVYEQTGKKKKKPVFEARESIPVVIWNSTTLKNDTCVSDENGFYLFENIESGEYTVLVIASGYQYFEKANVHLFAHTYMDIVVEKLK